MAGTLPIVYTIRGCKACVELLEKWNSEGIQYEERRAELSQATMDEARSYGTAVPIVVWPDGRVEQDFEGHIGCYMIPAAGVHSSGAVRQRSLDPDYGAGTATRLPGTICG